MSSEEAKWIARELNNLREDMQRGFGEVKGMIAGTNKRLAETTDEQRDDCSEHRKPIYERLTKLELNQMRYFLIGTGLGALIGCVMTLAIQVVLRVWLG